MGEIRIMCLRSYCHGYAGFVEDEHRYVYFNFPRQGNLKPLMTFDKCDYTDYGHFVGGITKFFPYNFFLKEPVVITACTITELDRISRDLAGEEGNGFHRP